MKTEVLASLRATIVVVHDGGGVPGSLLPDEYVVHVRTFSDECAGVLAHESSFRSRVFPEIAGAVKAIFDQHALALFQTAASASLGIRK